MVILARPLAVLRALVVSHFRLGVGVGTSIGTVAYSGAFLDHPFGSCSVALSDCCQIFHPSIEDFEVLG